MRALLIVLDSVGCGHAPDASAYGDSGSNTLGHILRQKPGLCLPTLEALGLQTALAVAAGQVPENRAPRIAVLTETSVGKDTTTGHWELAGAALADPFSTFTVFPAELVSAIEAEAGVTFIGNVAASGTVILEELGEEHVRTGHPILYTSADSVLQIAAHESVLPLAKLYAICEIARKQADRFRIGRVIARPFAGDAASGFTRTAGRHDYSMQPPRTILNALQEAGIPVTGIGKISDIFAGSGISKSVPTRNNADGMRQISRLWEEEKPGFYFANLVDFDMLFGHRRDVEGYATALIEFDQWLGTFVPQIKTGDLVLITADHGNDPTWQGTDHTRERVPAFILGATPAPDLPAVRPTFADVAATLATFFRLQAWPAGTSLISAPGGTGA